MKRSHRHSSLFLLEIMISILFFALVSASCLKVFAKAHQLSVETYNLNQGISQLENVAELLKSIDAGKASDADTVTEILTNYYGKSVDADAETKAYWQICFNSDWQACRDYDAVYYIELQQEDSETSNSLCTYTIKALDPSKDVPIEAVTLKLHTS